jgi:hypothetical protein
MMHVIRKMLDAMIIAARTLVGKFEELGGDGVVVEE